MSRDSALAAMQLSGISVLRVLMISAKAENVRNVASIS
jgi:hypothetical protein